MEKVKHTLSYGNPLKIYRFTRKYQGVLQGFYFQKKTTKPLYAPIYVDSKGKTFIDISQIREEIDK